MRKMKKTLSAATAVILATSLFAAGCGTQEAEQGGQTGTSAEAETTAASDLNSKTLDEIIEAAKEEGRVESVGMPDSWANWGLMWQGLADTYGLEHADADMSSAEELQMFATEGENGTKDIGDVGQAFGAQAVEEDLVQGYKTSYWDSVPDWAKGEDGKWMMAYTGATTFLVNTDLIEGEAPTSWQDIREGSYKVSVGDINGGNAQAAIVASAYAFGGADSDITDFDAALDAAFEFWTEMAEAGRINTVDITQQGFETGEVPVGVVWSFTAIPYKDAITEYSFEANIPTDGAILSGYASVINKYAPHPNAAALTREYIFSDEGQNLLAAAGAIPTRTDVEISEEFQANTFHTDDYANAIPMTDTDAYTAVCEKIVERWSAEILPLLVN